MDKPITVHEHLLAKDIPMDRYVFDTVWDRIWISRNFDGVDRSNRNRGFIQQDKEELWQFVEKLMEIHPKRMLEIGNACGGGTLLWQALVPEVYSLDIKPIEGHIPDSYFPEVNFLVGDTHEQSTLQMAKQFAPYDFIFIDGDHSTEGVKMDFEMYGPLVRKGGIIGFHDYNHGPVRTFLDTILDKLELMPRDYYGIAIYRVE